MSLLTEQGRRAGGGTDPGPSPPLLRPKRPDDLPPPQLHRDQTRLPDSRP